MQEVYTCGLVTECCVRATTLDALKEEGISKVTLIADACRGLGEPEDDAAVFQELREKGAHIVHVKDCL